MRVARGPSGPPPSPNLRRGKRDHPPSLTLRRGRQTTDYGSAFAEAMADRCWILDAVGSAKMAVWQKAHIQKLADKNFALFKADPQQA